MTAASSLLPDPQAIPTGREDAEAWAAYLTAVQNELDRLHGLSVQQKRRNTIWYMAWQRVTPGVSTADVFSHKTTCSKTIFYNKWMREDTPFADVLESVTSMTRRYIEGKDARKLAYRRDQLREMEWDAATALNEKVGKMMAFPLQRAHLEEEKTTGPDGRSIIIRKTTIEPADWRFGDAVRMADIMSKLGRRATGLDKDGISDDSADDALDGLTIDEWREQRRLMMEATRDQVEETLDILDIASDVDIDSV